MAMDAASRRLLLDEYFRLNAALEQPEAAHLSLLLDRRSQLRVAYEEGLPAVPLSRCPFTGELHAPPLDSFGLGGPYWDYHAPIRPRFTPPSTLLALTGAMKLSSEIEPAPFLAMPGPGAPYLYPRMLRDTAVKAVVYAFPLQRNIAIAIAYFGLERPPYLAMPNLWGAGHYEYEDGGGERHWYEAVDDESSRDYNLRPWIEAGALQWIAPADPGMELRNAVDGCPYLDMSGTQEDQYIYQGARS
jgi:hypothetical protein